MEEQFKKEIHALAQQIKGMHDQAVAVYTPLVDDICSRVAQAFQDIKVRICTISRSYKKHAVTSCTTSASEKNDKRIAHRVFRKRAKRALKNNKLSLLPFRMRDVSNIWCFAKDGKVTWEYLSSHSFFRRIVTDEQLQDIIKKARRK